MVIDTEPEGEKYTMIDQVETICFVVDYLHDKI